MGIPWYVWLIVFICAWNLSRADSPAVLVTIIHSAPMEELSSDGSVTRVFEVAAGRKYSLVKKEGARLLLLDTDGKKFSVAQDSTDYAPPPVASPGVTGITSPTSTLDSASVATVADPGPQLIHPGEIWPDDRGKHIQAHGGGIIKLGDTYYWFGEDRSKDNPPGVPVVSCYSSTDLVHWRFRNQVEKAEDPARLGPGWILERPKVFYNAKTGKYVMYAHLDSKGYKHAHVAVFTSDTVDGNYKYVTSFRPLGQESRDIGQFIDDDGSAYLIFESRPTHGFFIAKLSDDYLSVEKQVAFIQAPLEGGAIVHYNGLYYLIGSQMTGWKPNDNKYATATRLEGPWSEFQDIAPAGKRTYNSQSGFLLKVVGTKTTSVIFLGDWWVHTDHPLNLEDARYIWMPLQIGDGKLWLPQPRPWTIDIATGEVQVP